MVEPSRGPGRDLLLAALLAGIGAVALYVALTRAEPRGSGGFRDEPASGDVGFVLAYAQLPRGPLRLRVDEVAELPRPQDLVFGVTVQGTGPRLVKLQLVGNGLTLRSFEELVRGPLDTSYFDLVWTLGDTAPNEVTAIATIEAPHDRPRTFRYPIVLGRPLPPEAWTSTRAP